MRGCFNCGDDLEDGRTELCIECVRALETESGFDGKIDVETRVFLQLIAFWFAHFDSKETVEEHLARVVREMADSSIRRLSRADSAALERRVADAARAGEIDRYNRLRADGNNWRVAGRRAARETSEAKSLEASLDPFWRRHLMGSRGTPHLVIGEPTPPREAVLDEVARLRKLARKRASSIKVAASQRKTGKRR